MSTPRAGIAIRDATDGEVADAMAVLEAAMLEVDAGRVRAIADDDADGAVLAAVDAGAHAPSEGVVLGALVLEAAMLEADVGRVRALAVRPRRRNQGIGGALVRAAGERAGGPLVAAFDAGLRPFYEGLGFVIEPAAEDRCLGRLDTTPDDRR
jgi:GNAT superfamily N-acetyltransferase